VASTAEPATQVFLSYAREDRASAQALAAVLGADGHSVWWDRELEGGSDFAAEIERQLAQTRVAVVLWSAASVHSGFVRDESSRARDSGKLLPVRIEDVPLPLGFGTLHTLDLLDWDGNADDEACIALRDAVKRHLGGATTLPQALAALPIAKARQRWHTPAAILVATAAVAAGAWLWVQHDNSVRVQEQAREDALRREKQRQEDQAQAEALVDAGLRCNDELLRSASSPAAVASSQCALDLFTRALAKQTDLARAYYYLAQEYLRLYQQEQANGHDGEHLLAAARASLVATNDRQPPLDEAKRATAKRQLAAMEALAQPEAAALLGSARVVLASSAPTDLAQPPPAVMAGVAVPPPAAAQGQLIRVAASPAQQQLAQAQAEALLGPQREAQLAAASALTLDSTLAADTLPLLLQRTLASLAAQPDAPATRDAVALALRQLRSASPALQLELARDAQRVVDAGKQFGGAMAVAAGDVQARLARAQGSRPFVFVQIGDEAQRTLAERVVARMAAMGYSAPGIENVGMARLSARTEVRLQGASDPALARWMAQHLGKLTQAEVPLVTLRRAQPKTDTYEIWFDKELCITPARTVPACSAG
jgi:TIR domain